uniref:Cyclin-like domain-containing protein n=1 Tax=Piliocolobus tephrosceles TaxID=591936 RepID=A0A8C9GQW0_9PRIM
MNIQKIADNLKLSNQHIEGAQRIYLMALQRNFTMGRNNYWVAASCLYTICRREKSPIMLIDFSDILRTPVKPLGKTFLKLLRLLHISVPNIDPSLFLERFAHKLNLKNDVYKVTYTGIKLIQAMTRDWICTGRRPTGLCGAALLISARIHGISINSKTIADIVRISNPTIIKRLSEFKHTNTAKIKASEFDKIAINDIPSSTLPPCVISDKKKQFKLNIMKQNKLLSLCNSEEQNTSSTKPSDENEINTYSLDDLDNKDNSTSTSTCGRSDITFTYEEEHQQELLNLTQQSDDTLSICESLLTNPASSITFECDSMINTNTTTLDENGRKQKQKQNLTNVTEMNVTEMNVTETNVTETNVTETNVTETNEYEINTAEQKNAEEEGEDKNSDPEKNYIHLDEICNENPESNDIDILALKIVNSINLKNTKPELLKNENLHLLNQLKNINKKNEMKTTNGEKPMDTMSIKSTMSASSSIRISDVESSITNASIFSEKTNELYNSNNKCNDTNTLLINDLCSKRVGKFDNTVDSDINNKNIIPINKMSNNTNNVSDNNNDVSDNTNDVSNITNSSVSTDIIGNNTFNIYESNDNTNEVLDTIYCSALNETVHSELNHIIQNVTEVNLPASNKRNNDNLNETTKLNGSSNDVLTNLDYFFENNYNSTNKNNTDSVVNDQSFPSDQSYAESLSDTYDSEIENMILSEKEREIKMLIWDDMMKSYMPNMCKQYKKRKKKDNIDDINKKNKVTKKKNNLDDFKDIQSTGESVLKALEKTD